MRHEVLSATAELALIHLLIECGEKEVLEDRLVVAALFGAVVGEQRRDCVFIEQGFWKQTLLLEKPAKDDTSN
jgi:hypothetical protein